MRFWRLQNPNCALCGSYACSSVNALRRRSTDVELDGALDPSFDLALLAVFDPNEVLAEDYK
jgi:hypothetical protein